LDSVRKWRDDDPMVLFPRFVMLGTFVGQIPDLAMWVRYAELLSDSVSLNQKFDGQDVYTGREKGYHLIAKYQAGRGRWSAARSAMQAMDELGRSPAAASMAMNATLPSPGPFPVNVDSLLREVETWDIENPPEDQGRYLGGSLWGFGRKIRWYLLGLLNAERGDHEFALAYADSLDAMEPDETFSTLHQDFALGVRADVFMREDRPEAALDALERTPRRVHYQAERGIPGDREVFLRAQALHALGRYDEALRWYTPRGDRLPAPVLLAPSHYYRGQIYQELGDPEKALWHYGAFVELWKDADAEYQPWVEEVEGRMARLTAE
jgi:hypothetical protein